MAKAGTTDYIPIRVHSRLFAVQPPPKTSDYWAPSNWQSLDSGDLDIGSSGALLVDVPGAAPSRLIVACGKDGNAYLLNRTNLGGTARPCQRRRSRPRRAMKVLLRNLENGTFYKHPNSWVSLPEAATDFESLEKLRPLATRPDVAKLEALVTFENGEPMFGIYFPSLPAMLSPLDDSTELSKGPKSAPSTVPPGRGCRSQMPMAAAP